MSSTKSVTDGKDEEPPSQICPICLHDVSAAAPPVAATNDDDDNNNNNNNNNNNKADSSSTKHPSAAQKLAHGPCGHCFCVPCLERHLNAPRHTSTPSHDEETARITITLGLCPMCRAELSLFDLVYENTHEAVYSSSSDTPLECTPLCGAVYRDASPQWGGVGKGSFHFPSQMEECSAQENGEDDANGSSTRNSQSTTTKTTTTRRRAYYSIEHIPAQARHLHEPTHWYFDQWHYHATTRTFSGTVHFSPRQFPYTSQSFQSMRAVLSFSYDMRFVTRGVIIKHCRQFESLAELQAKYPLDGAWSVVRVAVSDNQTDKKQDRNRTVTVNRNRTDDNNHVVEFALRQNEEADNGATIRLIGPLHNPSLPIAQIASYDLAAQPTGPDIGQTLEWWRWSDTAGGDSKSNSKVLVERWTRMSCLEPDALHSMRKEVIIPVGGRSGHVYKRLEQDNAPRRQIPTYHSSSVWGNTFCQAYKVGLASYHFVSAPADNPDNPDPETANPHHVAYISYEHAATGQWPPLDDGMPIPDRIYFRNVHQPDPCTFCGQICWWEDYNTTWQGSKRWDYEMRLDSQFLCIVSGRVRSWMVDHDEHRDMSVFGETLIYCNAALYDVFREQIDNIYRSTSTDNNNMAEEGIAILAKHTQLRERLESEGASLRVLSMVGNIWMVASQRKKNPIDFNTPSTE